MSLTTAIKAKQRRMTKESELTPENSSFQPKSQIYPYLSVHLEDEGEAGAETSSSSYNTLLR